MNWKRKKISKKKALLNVICEIKISTSISCELNNASILTVTVRTTRISACIYKFVDKKLFVCVLSLYGRQRNKRKEKRNREWYQDAHPLSKFWYNKRIGSDSNVRSYTLSVLFSVIAAFAFCFFRSTKHSEQLKERAATNDVCLCLTAWRNSKAVDW